MSNCIPKIPACAGTGQTHTTYYTYNGPGQIHTNAHNQANGTINVTDKQPSNLVGLANGSQQAASTANSQPKNDGFGQGVRLATIPNLPSDLLPVDKNDITDEHAEKHFHLFWILDENQSGCANGFLSKEQHTPVFKESLFKLH